MFKYAMMVGLLAAAVVGCQVATTAPEPVRVAYHAAAPVQVNALLADPGAYFLTQNRTAQYNPMQPPGTNANCGPASLAMALRAFGRAPAGMDSPAKAHDLVQYVRKAMTGQVDEQAWTYPDQVKAGAQQLGLKADTVFTARNILEAVAQPGHLVVVNLNPSPAYVDQLADAYDGGHFALLTGVDGQQVTLDDPLAPHPIKISRAQLEEALTTSLGTDPYGQLVPAYNGGVALSL
jgi:predicted double-glycine peptidase